MSPTRLPQTEEMGEPVALSPTNCCIVLLLRSGGGFRFRNALIGGKGRQSGTDGMISVAGETGREKKERREDGWGVRGGGHRLGQV